MLHLLVERTQDKVRVYPQFHIMHKLREFKVQLTFIEMCYLRMFRIRWAFFNSLIEYKKFVKFLLCSLSITLSLFYFKRSTHLYFIKWIQAGRLISHPSTIKLGKNKGNCLSLFTSCKQDTYTIIIFYSKLELHLNVHLSSAFCTRFQHSFFFTKKKKKS